MFLLKPDDDPIILLDDYYFSATDVVYVEFEKLWMRFDKGVKLSDKNLIRMQRFLQIWLATLYVTAEGFKHSKVCNFYKDVEIKNQAIRVHWGTIHHQICQLGSELSKYRNATFHYQNNLKQIINKRSVFLENSYRRAPIRWARELHDEMRGFFKLYRSEAFFRKVDSLGSRPERG